ESQVLAESVNYGTGKQNRYQQINHFNQDVDVVDNFKQELGGKQFDSLKLSTLNPQTSNNIPQTPPIQQANSFLQSSTIAQNANFPQSTTAQQHPVFTQGSTVQQNGEFRQISTVQQSTTLQQSTNVPQSTTFQQVTTNQQTTSYPQSTTIQDGSTYPQISTIQNTDYPQSTTYQDSTTYQQGVTNPLSTTYQQIVNDLQSTNYQQGVTNPLTTTYQQTDGDTQTTLQQGTTAGLTQSTNTANNLPTSNVRYTTPLVQESSTPVYSTIKESTLGYSTIKDTSFPTTFSGSTLSPDLLSTANFNRISLNQQSNLVPEANYNTGEENANAIDSISIYYDQINNKESVRIPVTNSDTKNKISVSDIFLNSNVPSTSYDLSNSLPSVLTDSTKEGYSFLFSNGSSDASSIRDNVQTVSKSPIYESLIPQQNQGIVQGISSTVSQYTTAPPPSTTTVTYETTATQSPKDLELKHSSDLRELAQVFSRALSAYLEDPENFRRILSEVRPTEPNIRTSTANPYNNEVLEFSEDNKIAPDTYKTRVPSSTPQYTTIKEEYKSSSIANQVNNLVADTASSYFPPPRNLYGGFQNNSSVPQSPATNVFEGTTQTYYSVSPLIDVTRSPEVYRASSTTKTAPAASYRESNPTIGAQDVNNLAPSRSAYDSDLYGRNNVFNADNYDYSFGANAKKATQSEDQESLIPYDSQSIVSKENLLLRFQNAQKKYLETIASITKYNNQQQPNVYQTIKYNNNAETIEKTRNDVIQESPQKIDSNPSVASNYYYSEGGGSQGIPSSTYSSVNFIPTESPQYSQSPQYYYNPSSTPSSASYVQNQFLDNGSMYQEAKEIFGNLNETSANMLMDVMHEAESNTTLRRLVLLLVNDKTGKKTPEETRNKLLEALLQMPQRVPSYPPESISRTTYSPKVPRRVKVLKSRTLSSNENKSSTKFQRETKLDYPKPTNQIQTESLLPEKLSSESDTRAVELLKSLYVLAAKWG
ncbi:hypothetical protein WDU94_009358, partial [Cyamophila willieti]